MIKKSIKSLAYKDFVQIFYNHFRIELVLVYGRGKSNMHTTLTSKKTFYKYPLILIVGFLLSGTSLFGEAAPFCIAFIGSLSGFGCIAAFVGATLGLVLNTGGLSFFPTLISMIAVGIFRLFFGKKYSLSFNLLSAVLTGACVLISGFVSASKTSDLLNSLALALISAVVAYSLVLCYDILKSKRFFTELKPVNAAAVSIVFIFCITALSSYEIINFNLGVVLSVFLILSFSNKYQYNGGAISGILAAFGLALGNPDFIIMAVVITFAAIGSGLFKNFGKSSVAAGFVLFSGLGAAFIDVTALSWSNILSTIMGAALFLLIPADKLTEKFSSKPISEKSTSISEIYAKRINLIGTAISEVKLAVEKTSEILDKRNIKNNAWIYNSACDSVCRKCRHNMKCWGDEYDETVKAMESLTKLQRTGRQLKIENLPYNITERCNKKEQLIYSLNRQFHEYVAQNTASRKLAEMRGILTAQLSATEKMLDTMAEDFEKSIEFDPLLSAKTEEILNSNGIHNPKAAILASDGRISLEAYGKGTLAIGAEQLCGIISTALRREFDLPNIMYNGKDFRMTMYERAIYSIEYGAFQMGKGQEKNCGDYYDNFIDGKGNAYIILSDGMGSGGRARIDSAFACGMLIKLLQAGVSIESGIEIINNSLLVKSMDESFATLDICKIDLYSGRVSLYKAGSAPTYIKCNKRIVKANGKGMPVGISGNPVYEMQSFTIGNSDVVIMTSDGAEISERWLEHELGKEEMQSKSMKNIAETVASAAKYATAKGREDDISVIAVKLIK